MEVPGRRLHCAIAALDARHDARFVATRRRGRQPSLG